MANKANLAPNHLVRDPDVPVFTLEELFNCIDVILNEDSFGTTHSIKGFLKLAVRELRLDGMSQDEIDTIKFDLVTLTELAHRNVLRYYQVVEGDDFIYVTMDRYDKNLDHFLTDHKRKKTPIPNSTLFSILRQIIDALAYLHSVDKIGKNGQPYHGIHHGDLKPSNIFISADGKSVVLANVGLYKDSLKGSTNRIRKSAYMAPETLISQDYSPSADIWAFGCIVYELATLKKPNFIKLSNPQDVFVDGWTPDLTAVTDSFIKDILGQIFVLDSANRPTASVLSELLHSFNIPVEGFENRNESLEDRCRHLEQALNNANAKIEFLEEELRDRTNEVISLKVELRAKLNEFNFSGAQPKAQDRQISQISNPVFNSSSLVPTMQCSQQRDGTVQLHPRGAESGFSSHGSADRKVEAKKHKNNANKNNAKKVDHSNAMHTPVANQDYQNMLNLVDPTDKNGVTALMRAADMGNVELVKLLIPYQKGKRATGTVYIKRYPMTNRTALMGAAAYGHTEVVKLLIEHEGGMTLKSGWTALMEAVRNNHPECAALLLEKEARMQRADGKTALMYAVIFNHPDCVRVLVRMEKDIKNKDGKTALDIARQVGYKKIEAILLEH